MTEEWYAAVLDCRGMIKFIKRKGRLFPAVDIHSRILSEKFAERFGGNRERWHVSGRNAQAVLAILWPHMHLKCKEVAEMMAWKPETKRHTPLAARKEITTACPTNVQSGV